MTAAQLTAMQAGAARARAARRREAIRLVEEWSAFLARDAQYSAALRSTEDPERRERLLHARTQLTSQAVMPRDADYALARS